MLLLLPLIIVILLMIPLIPLYKGVTTKKAVKRRLIFNISGFFGVFLLAIIMPVSQFVSAASESTAVVESASGMGFIAAALATGLSALGAGIAVAAAAPAAIGACSEDPKSFGKSLIFVALGEGVALYGLLISILILNQT